MQRIVLKIGSSLVAPSGSGCSTRYTLGIAELINYWMDKGHQVILVSSGAVAAGVLKYEQAEHAEINRHQLSLPQKQAMAAIGQSRLMSHWQRFFDCACAQLLLSRSDLESSKRAENASNTIEALLQDRCLPIVNENDSVVVHELVVGDNDQLAAHVAVLTRANYLVILSDVDGLFDRDPNIDTNAKLLRQVKAIDDQILALAGDSNNPLACGGMRTKILAAKIATEAGVSTWLVNGRKGNALRSLRHLKCAGTRFEAPAIKRSVTEEKRIGTDS